MNSTRETQIFKDPPELFGAAAAIFADLASTAIRARGKFTVALSGGSTPKGLYTLLAKGEPPVQWEKVCFFWGDERHVPPSDPESNYRMTDETLLSKVHVKPENIFRIHGEEKDTATAAEMYEEALIKFFELQPGEFPRLDLVLLGIGTEGHTASLFPGTSALEEKERLVVANWVEKLQTDRITMTLPVLNSASVVMFMVTGNEKAKIVQQALQQSADPELPCQRVRPKDGRLLWLLDHAAAGRLTAKGGLK